jgi:hypothetical protein
MTTALLLLLAGADAADVRFEPAGVWFGDVLLSGAALELREGALVSGRAVEPLVAALRVDAGNGLTLKVEPGVRVMKDVDGLRLSAHAPARLRISSLDPADSWETVLLRRTSSGWAVGETALTGDVGVSLQGQPQQDPDAASRRMEEAARKMRESGERVRKPLRRPVFTGNNPLVPGAAADSESVRQLVEISPAG